MTRFQLRLFIIIAVLRDSNPVPPTLPLIRKQKPEKEKKLTMEWFLSPLDPPNISHPKLHLRSTFQRSPLLHHHAISPSRTPPLLSLRSQLSQHVWTLRPRHLRPRILGLPSKPLRERLSARAM